MYKGVEADAMNRITFHSTIATIIFASFFIVILSVKHCDSCFSPSAMALKFFVVGFVFIGGSFYFKKQFLETEGIIFDVESEPMIHTDEAVGDVPFAGEGIIEKGEEGLLESTFTKTPCVYYHAVIEKLVGSGKNRHWKIDTNLVRFVPFYIRDGKGRLKIDLTDMDEDFSEYDIPLPERSPNPINSEIDCVALMNKRQYTEKKPGFLGFSAVTKYRRSEYALLPGTKVFVYGWVKGQDGQLILIENERCPLIISRKNREEYINEFYRGGHLVYLASLLQSIGYTVSIFALDHFMRWDAIVFWFIIIAGNSLIFGSFLFSLYNRMITLKVRALNAESNIDAELARRAQLIPQLVETVKGYSKYEKEIQQIIAEARVEKIFSKEMIGKTTAVIPSLAMAIENYPDIKAASNFQALMGTLVDTENRISYSREFYNRYIRKYNSLIGIFPYVLVSSLLNMKEMEYLSISHEDRSVPESV